jgi:hypothetical protein
MSLGLIPYQPLPFGLEENCTLPCSSWIQKIARTDRTSFQFTYGACGNTNNVLTNGDFTSGGTGWTVSGAWTYSFGWANSPGGGAGSIEQAIALTGFVEVTFGLEVNAGSMLLSSNLGLIDFYTFGGSKSVVFDATGMNNLNFFFGTAAGGRIQNVIVRPISSDVRVAALDSDGNFLDYITGPLTKTITDGFITFNIQWDPDDTDNGCYSLAVYDPCQCSQFGFIGDDFDTPNQFVVSVGGAGNVDVSGGDMTVTNSGVSAVTVLRQNVLCVGTEYTLTYTLTNMSVGDSFRFAAGTANGILRTADGTYTETITVTAANDNPQDLRFVFGFVGGLHAVVLNGFSIEAVTPIATYESVQFRLTDAADCANCTVLVSACGNGDQFNFGFDGTGFKPQIRLDGTLRGSGYPSTRTEYEYSTGKRVVPYARLRKARSLLFGAPEYVHDFMQTLIAIDNVYINGALSYCEDSEYPTPSMDDNVDYSTVTMTFSAKTELTEKRPCAATADIGCPTSGVYGVTYSGTGGLPWGVGAANKAEAINGLILTYNG